MAQPPTTKRTSEALSRAARERPARVGAGALAATGAALAVTKAATELRRRVGDRGERDSASAAYRLKRTEPVAEGVKRIAAGRANSAAGHLRGEEGEDLPVAVHKARKDLKKLRSVIRLVRKPLGDDVYRRENERFRDAGRMLAGMRDEQARAETLEGLR